MILDNLTGNCVSCKPRKNKELKIKDNLENRAKVHLFGFIWLVLSYQSKVLPSGVGTPDRARLELKEQLIE